MWTNSQPRYGARNCRAALHRAPRLLSDSRCPGWSPRGYAAVTVSLPLYTACSHHIEPAKMLVPPMAAAQAAVPAPAAAAAPVVS